MKIIIFLLVLFSLLINLNGCSLVEISEQVRKAEGIGSIKGSVQRTSSQQGNIIIDLYYLKDKTYIMDSFARVDQNGEYQFDRLPGTYYLAAYIDNNYDGEYQEGEHEGIYSFNNGKPAPVIVYSGQTTSLPSFSISENSPQLDSKYTIQYVKEKGPLNIGQLTRLDSQLFERNNYSMGMWKPIQFLEQVGAGLFFLEEYQVDKIPVLFIHGLNGGPLDWQQAIDSLDRSHFQPWFVYYPTGLRLNMISNYFIKAISYLQDKYQFKQLFVVAHSMGGIVARSTVKKYQQHYPELANSIKLLMTINSPLNGMASAGLGVANSPLVLPVWHDLAPNSKFLTELNSWLWPEDVAYYLVFSYLSDTGDDGIVPLASQIPLEFQESATRIYGFNTSHSGILKDESFLRLLNSILEEKRLQE